MSLTPYKQLEQEWQRLHAFRGAASLLRWIHVLLTGEMLAFRHLQQPGRTQPLRAIAVVATTFGLPAAIRCR